MGVFNLRPRPATPHRTRSKGQDPLTATSFGNSKVTARDGSKPSTTQPGGFSKGRATPLPFNAHRGLTAAARSIRLDNADEVERLAKRRNGDTWQQEAWEYYDAIGEIKFALALVANVCSRVRLHAARVDDPSKPPTPLDPNDEDDKSLAVAADVALARLDSAFGGQPGLIRDFALNIVVTGECYLVQKPATLLPPTQESWDIRSVDELTVNGSNQIVIKTRRDQTSRDERLAIKLPTNAFVARLWRPHPRFSDESDSSMKGILDLCAELLLLNRTFRATARSRLNAGAMYLPDGLSVSATPDTEFVESDEAADPLLITAATDEPVADDDDDFEEALMDAMTTPITDEESAAAVVPLLIRGPAELGEKIKLFKFERSFDPALATRADKVLDRIMQGIDVPKDIVTGLANVKYANAVHINETLYKAHIEPLILLLCDALTVVYLRPALRAAKIPDYLVNKLVVWYDPTEVTTRPDRSDDADKGWDRDAISWSAWRRAHGFNDDDAPDPNELVLRSVISKGNVSPELAEAVFGAIAPDFMSKVRDASQASSAAPLPADITQALGGPDPGASPTPPPEPPAADAAPPADVGPATAGPAPPSPPGQPITPTDVVSPSEVTPG